jgi:diguanylate cyclase (GGDEF)-like protein
MPHVDLFTLYLAIAAACLSASLVWLVVARTFPMLHAARFWFAGTLTAGIGAGLSTWHAGFDPMVPKILGHALIVLGSGIAWAGVRRFHGRPAPWAMILGITVTTAVALSLATYWHDSMALRVMVFSAAQSLIIGWVVVDVLDRRNGTASAGTLMAAGACSVLLLLNALRTIVAMLALNSDMALTFANPQQTAPVLLFCVFAALVCQFGFLLMTMDRLHAEMTELAGIDDLTGAANRRRFLAACEAECIRSVRSNRTFSVMVIDVDRFKAINDSHGHAVGDEVLKQFARTTRAHLRAQDLLARIGGDEFCVLMPETDGAQAERIADRLAATVRKDALSRDGVMIRFTISVGVSEWSPAIGRDPFLLLERADVGLYLTKRRGRDGVTVAPSLPAPATPRPVAA